jgi:hypothetical protein
MPLPCTSRPHPFKDRRTKKREGQAFEPDPLLQCSRPIIMPNKRRPALVRKRPDQGCGISSRPPFLASISASRFIREASSAVCCAIKKNAAERGWRYIHHAAESGCPLRATAPRRHEPACSRQWLGARTFPAPRHGGLDAGLVRMRRGRNGNVLDVLHQRRTANL